MRLTVLTPQRRLVENEEIDEIFLPGSKGQLDVLPMHANFVTQLETGDLRWRSGGSWQSAAISFGVLEIVDQHVIVLADVAELSEDIDLTRAQTAEAKAQKAISEGGLDDANFRKQELKLARAEARIHAKNHTA